MTDAGRTGAARPPGRAGRTALPVTSLHGQGRPLATAEAQRDRLARLPLAREFEEALGDAGLGPLRARGIDVLQVNVGKLCNQTCRHCHVDAGPDRVEVMSREVMAQCLRALEEGEIPALDITGGAPELNPHFRWLVASAHALGVRVIHRCNLTLLETAAHRDLPGFFAEHAVEVIGSLPHYRAFSTDRQRGRGVFERSLAALRRLNAVGYGQPGSGLTLSLVTNPVGAFLPPSQASLEREWQREMERLYGVRFNRLFCITNMPISRYLEWLEVSENLESYMQRLVDSFSPAAAQGVMCRNMLSVAWDGRLYDCDFNQMLELPVDAAGPAHIAEFATEPLAARAVVVGRHCFGCTAGAGSSCGGETA